MFKKEVDITNRNAMIEFLTNHFRYYTMNSWNRNTSYANNVKLHKLDLPEDCQDTAFAILDCEEPNEFTIGCRSLMQEFRCKTGYDVGFNGRSGGYLVLYDTKAVFDENNPTTVKEWKTIVTSIDDDETFEDWDDAAIRERVEIVMQFDDLCDNIRNFLIETCKNYVVTEKILMVPKVISVLEEK